MSVHTLIRSLLAIGGIALLAAGCGSEESDKRPTGGSSKPAGAKAPAPDKPETSVAVEGLSVPEQAGQLVITKLDGTSLSDMERRELRDQHLSGVILFAYNYQSADQLRELTREVQEAVRGGNSRKVGALVSIDQEGGFVRRINSLPPERSQRDLGRLDDPDLTKRTAAAAAKGLLDVGINYNLAPVADLALPPNRTMADRAYGADPERVASMVAAAVEGSEANGVATAPKHFPGFGGASINSDFGRAKITRTRKQMEEDLAPFSSAVAAEAASIMVSHGVFPALDAKRPASLSKPIIEGILRTELGYEGVAITDSLNARGLREEWGSTVPRACVEAVRVGIDLILLTGSMETARLCRQRITRAVYRGEIAPQRVAEAATRVLAMKRKLGLTG